MQIQQMPFQLVFELVKFINVNSSEQNSKEYLQALYQEIRDLV